MFLKKHELLKLDFLSSPGKPTGYERFSGLSSRNSTKLSVMNIHSGETTTDSKSHSIPFSLPYFIKITKKNESFLRLIYNVSVCYIYLFDYQFVMVVCEYFFILNNFLKNRKLSHF